MKEAKVIFKSPKQPPIPYRIYSISKEGIHLGGSPIGGRFPWRNAQSVARGIIRAWARDLVSRHDEAQLSAILQRWAKDWLAEHIPVETNPAVVEPPPPQQLLGWLRDKSMERKSFFENQDNNRDGTVMFKLSEEMIEAVAYGIKKITTKPQIDEYRFSLYRTMWDRLFRKEDKNGK